VDGRTIVLYALGVLQAYFLGAVPFGFILAKVLKGIDVRTVGSGNIGATNVGRAAGPKIGILAFVLDVAKGFVAATWIPFAVFAIASGHYTYNGVWDFLEQSLAGKGFADLRILCGLAAIAGHVWTIFLGFKGGKGVATSLGVLLGLAPWPTVAALFVWSVVTRASGYVSLGSVVSAVALPAALVVVEWGHLAENWHLLAATAAVAAIVVVRHRGNIKRLLDGTESRMSFKRRRGRK
jgi:glycerol-3-phosphate acyltransferase PlsY